MDTKSSFNDELLANKSANQSFFLQQNKNNNDEEKFEFNLNHDAEPAIIPS